MSFLDSETAIEGMDGEMEKLTEEIATLTLTKGVKTLDKSVAEATEQPKEESAEYKGLKQNDVAAKEIFAKNRLNKFYAPKLYTPELLQETGMYVQVSSHQVERAAPPPPPESFNAYTKKSEEGTGHCDDRFARERVRCRVARV